MNLDLISFCLGLEIDSLTRWFFLCGFGDGYGIIDLRILLLGGFMGQKYHILQSFI
jgi:hypothetical protein